MSAEMDRVTYGDCMIDGGPRKDVVILPCGAWIARSTKRCPAKFVKLIVNDVNCLGRTLAIIEGDRLLCVNPSWCTASKFKLTLERSGLKSLIKFLQALDEEKVVDDDDDED